MVRSVPVRAAAAAGVVALVVAGATACGASAGDDKTPDHKSFALHGRTLTVDSDDSALEIVAADSNKAGTVEVTRWFQGTVAIGKDPEVTWSMKGDRLVLRMKCSGVIADCSVKHRIEVPRGVAVKVEDGDGSVRARGFTDALNVRTHDGSVHVTDSTGPLTLRSGDGSVHAEVSSREVRATTGDGSVHLELGAVPDLVESRSGDGSVTIALPKDGGAKYRVTTGTGDGSVDVSVPRDSSSSHVVTAHTGDGKVTVRNAN
jgi:Putative adhesin